MKKVELLAPAGDIQKLKVAISNGADAVYLGIDEFNARANEENFNMDLLHEGINYAHLFGVKVYLALNILFKDDEIERVLEVTEKALLFGVDGFIIQDIGIASLIKHHFPNAVLHASTQMGCSNLEGAKFLKDVGFCRIVLARETSLEDIRLIKQNLDIEIEYFVQGALCVSYSGNCYLCSLLAGASGNRGKCKQFCRLPCTMSGNGIHEQGYLLSTKDICMAKKLKDLIDAGVDSLKIEGRARRPAYVGIATGVYRDILDRACVNENDILSLKKVFNRGDYSEGYLSGEKLIFDKAQNHIGIEIGRVEKINKGKRFNEIFILSKHEISKGDLLKFFDKNIERGVVSVVDCKKMGDLYKITSTFTPNKGDSVRLILDASEEEKVLKKTRPLLFNAEFVAHEGERAKLVLSHNDTFVQIESESIIEGAKNSPLTEEDVKNCLNKIAPPFTLDKLKINIGNVFIVKSALNDLRREGENKLKEKIINDYLTKNNLIFKKNHEKMQVFSKKQEIKKYFMTNINNFVSGYDGYILYPNSYDDNIFLSLDFKDQKIYLATPVFASQKEVEKIKDILKKYPYLGIYANNYYALNLTDKEKTIIGGNMNVFNSYSVKFYCENGYKDIVLTKENIDLSQIKNSGGNLAYFSSFYPEYMHFAHCPIKEHLSGKCVNCSFKEGYEYKISGRKLRLVRHKLLSCHFALKDSIKKEEYYPSLSRIEEE